MGSKQSTVAPADGENKTGKPFEHDPNFNGPINEGRKCRDVLCLLLFILFWIVWILEAILVITDGCPDNCNTPLRLVYGYDSSGTMCGGNVLPNSKRMFIGMPAQVATSRVCVDTCPTTVGMMCVDANGRQKASTTLTEMAQMGLCYDKQSATSCCYITYPTKEVLFKCVPDLGIGDASYNSSTMGPATTLNSAISFATNPSGMFGAAIGKLIQYWVVIAASVIVALVLGFIWLLFLRLFVGVMVWVTVVGLLLFLIILTIFAWEKAGEIDISKATDITDQYVNTSGVEVDKNTARVLAAILSVITIIYFLLFCVFMQRIRIAIQVIKEAAKAIAAMPFLVLYPVVTFISLLVLFVWWIAILSYLASAGEFDPKTMTFSYPDTATCVTQMKANSTLIQEVDATALCRIYKSNVNTALAAWYPPSNARATVYTASSNSTAATAVATFFSYKSQIPIQLSGKTYNFFLLFHLFGGLWTYAFTLGVSYLVVAGSVASWYWAIDKKRIGAFPVLASLKRAIRYHLGSVAFGSLILAIIRTIQIVFNYMMNRMKGAKDHPVVKILICIVNCCLSCLERFVNFLNKNAYIMIAIHGKSFCPSAKDAFMLLLRNALRVAAINVIGDLMLLLGKIFVCFGTLFAAWAYFQAIKKDPTLLPAALQPSGVIDTTPIFPLIIIACFGFVIGCAFMGIFETSIDTIFLSFCEDCERNKESSPYMPDSLRKIVGRSKPPKDANNNNTTTTTNNNNVETTDVS